MEYYKKAECIKNSEENNLVFFQRDLNTKFSKIFISDSYQNIWNKIKENGVLRSHYYYCFVSFNFNY